MSRTPRSGGARIAAVAIHAMITSAWGMPKRLLVGVVSRTEGTVSVAIAFTDMASVPVAFGLAAVLLAAVEGLVPTEISLITVRRPEDRRTVLLGSNR